MGFRRREREAVRGQGTKARSSGAAVPGRGAKVRGSGPTARGWGVTAVLLATAACASAPPEAPPPISPPGDPDPAGVRPSRMGLSVAALPPATPPPLPPVPPDVQWTPKTPLQGTVLALMVARPPGGEQPVGLIARFGGRPVRLGEAGDGWFGLAALPLDSAGVFDLVLRYRQAGAEREEAYAVRVRERSYASSRLRVAGRGEARPDVQERILRERERIRETLLSSGDEWLPETRFGWPRPPDFTGPFGQRRVFNDVTRSRHLGLDMRGARGAPVYAPAAGRVLLAGDFFYQGNAVYLDHGLGLVTAYFHLSSIDVREGDRVEPGDLLGRVGSTGRSTAPHLHWSAYVEGENIDPASLLELPVPGWSLERASAEAR